MKKLYSILRKFVWKVMCILVACTACAAQEAEEVLFGQDTAGWTLETYRRQSLAMHDPEVIYEDGKYYIYYTNYCTTFVSEDLYTWSVAGERPVGWYSDEPRPTSWAPCALRLKKPYVAENGETYGYVLLDGLSAWGSQDSRIRGFVMKEPAPASQKEILYIGDVMSSGIYAFPDPDAPYHSFEGTNNGKETAYYTLVNYANTFDGAEDNGWNAMDQTLFYDAEDRLWMVWGSYHGGLFVCEMNQDTLMPMSNDADTYTRIAKYPGYGPMEGATIMYHDGYYYLCMAYGDIWNTYNIRIARAESVTGPYHDYNGENVDQSGTKGTGNIGTKLAGPYAFDGDVGWKGQGHCAFVHNPDTDEYFLLGNGRPGDDTSDARLIVRSILWLKSGWPVLSPELTTAETTRAASGKAAVPSVQDIPRRMIVGEYEVIYFHRTAEETNRQMHSKKIILQEDGAVSGTMEGSWQQVDGSHITLTLDGLTIEAAVTASYDWEKQKSGIITFSGLTEPGSIYLGEHGTAVWGKQVRNKGA